MEKKSDALISIGLKSMPLNQITGILVMRTTLEGKVTWFTKGVTAREYIKKCLK